MLLHKTTRAHAALQSARDANLSLADRRILILADGRRSLNELVGLLGSEALPSIERLLRERYLEDGRAGVAITPARSSPPAGVGSALSGLLRASTDAVQARAGSVRAPPSQASASAPPATIAPSSAGVAAGRQRRSLVAAKMYVIDMLQLQRHPDAVDLKARLQCCSDPHDLLALLLEAAQALHRLTSASFGERIMARLREVVPEDALPALEQAFRQEAADGETTRPRMRLVGG